MGGSANDRREAHEVMEEIELEIAREFPGVEILIHLDPEGQVDQLAICWSSGTKRKAFGMKEYPVPQVDAFATGHSPPSGSRHAAPGLLSADLLQSIAWKNKLSETAFTVPIRSGGKIGRSAGIRYELAGHPDDRSRPCGHATLAAAHVLMDGDDIHFETRRAGPLDVSRDGGAYAMSLPAWKPEPRPLPRTIEALGCRAIDTLWHPHRYAVVVLESAQEIAELRPDFSALAREGDVLIIATAPGRDTDMISRVFAPGAGIDEDPVTGSAHAVLMPYWAERLGRDRLTAFQASRRGGELTGTLSGDRVVLGGRCITTMEGVMRL